MRVARVLVQEELEILGRVAHRVPDALAHRVAEVLPVLLEPRLAPLPLLDLRDEFVPGAEMVAAAAAHLLPLPERRDEEAQIFHRVPRWVAYALALRVAECAPLLLELGAVPLPILDLPMFCLTFFFLTFDY